MSRKVKPGSRSEADDTQRRRRQLAASAAEQADKYQPFKADRKRLQSLAEEGRAAALVLSVFDEVRTRVVKCWAEGKPPDIEKAAVLARIHDRLEEVHYQLQGQLIQLGQSHDVVREHTRAIADRATDRYRAGLKETLDRIAGEVEEEVKRGFTAATTLIDFGRQLKLWENKSAREPFATQVVKRHLAEKRLEAAVAPIKARVETSAQQEWTAMLEQLAANVEEHAVALEALRPEHGNLQVAAGPGLAANVALYGLGSATAATLVLAAGWHTLAWSVGGLFLPALPVVVVATWAAAVMNRDAEAEKAARAAREAVENLRNYILDRADNAGRLALREGLEDAGKQLMSHVCREVGGVARHDDLRWLIKLVVGVLARVKADRRRLAERFQDAPAADPTALGRRAHSALAKSDLVAALVYAAVAVEGLLRRIVRSRGVQHDFSQPGALVRAIDALRRSGAIGADECGALHRLRESRNEILHNLDALAVQSPDEQRRRAEILVGELDRLTTTLLGN